MSYKISLTDIDRDGPHSVTRQLADRFVAAIAAGELEPGEKLPPTRALAEEAGVNHLTAARVYRRLADEGYVTATVGRGTFVRALTPSAGEEHGDEWQSLALPERAQSYSEESLADVFAYAADPNVISLGTGWPAPSLYPTEQLADITREILDEEGTAAFTYLTAAGLDELRDQLAARGRKLGYASEAEEILVTSGAQQAIDITVRALVAPGDTVAVESPTYSGLLSVLRANGARVIGVPVDEDGLDVDALEDVVGRHELKLVALQTGCQNPTGADLSAERRERLAALARERNLIVMEDGVYGDLRFDGGETPALRELAPAHVIYVDSLSKTVGGGLRVGWLAARGPVTERLAMLKLESDFHSATLPQLIAARYLASGGYEQHLRKTAPIYRERRDAMLAALEHHLPGELRTTVPHGGHHVWATLERPVDERQLYAEAIRHGVGYVPGGAVTVDRRGQTSMRLSYSLLDPPEVEEGIKRLARALREVRRRARGSGAMTFS
jgi:GntR family transcriptional regulator/MocR family aminotransferase